MSFVGDDFNIYRRSSIAEFNKVYEVLWKDKGFNFTKEVYRNVNLDFFERYFEIFFLYRHRKYTFPGTYDDWFIMHYNHIMKTNFENQNLRSIKQYIFENAKTRYEKICSVHIFEWYINLKHCQKHFNAVIEYEKLMILNEEELEEYLNSRIPSAIYSNKLLAILVKERYETKKALYDREKSYNQLKVEEFCKRLVGFIKALDKDFLYSYYLE